MKECTKCKKSKPFTDFSKDKQKKTGYSSQCKQCRSLYEKEYYKNNKEKVNTRNNKYNETYKKRKQELDAKRRKEKREEINKKKREYYHSTGKAVGNLWRANNPEKCKTYAFNRSHKRREKIKTSTLTSSEVRNWLSQQVLICSYCNVSCIDNYHVDHIEPLSKNGVHELSNFTISCPTCNISKGNKSILYWFATNRS